MAGSFLAGMLTLVLTCGFPTLIGTLNAIAIARKIALSAKMVTFVPLRIMIVMFSTPERVGLTFVLGSAGGI